MRFGGLIVVAGVVFLFVPFLPFAIANFGGGGTSTTWESPSFAFFRCGVVIGGHEVANGSTVNPSVPFSFWYCG